MDPPNEVDPNPPQQHREDQQDGGAHASGAGAARRRLLLAAARARCARLLCCCCCACGGGRCGGACGASSSAAVDAAGAGGNKILPVTLAPTDCDYLEMRPNRRVRVIHLPGCARSAADSGPKLRRSATTISRNANEKIGSGDTEGEDEDEDEDEEEEEDEEYWFENAAPRRMPIRPDEDAGRRKGQQHLGGAGGGGGGGGGRIFNKFEPQKPPSIAGINPPRASLIRHQQEEEEGGKETPKQQQQQQQQHQQQHQQQRRLQRKVILPAAALMVDQDEDEELVQDLPGEEGGAGEGQRGGGSGDRSPSPKSPVMEENFVASVLADMNGLVLNITADATDAPKESNGGAAEESTGPNPKAASPNTAATSSSTMDAASPTPDRRTVKTEPDPEEKEEEEGGRGERGGKVVVTGGNLGGVANVAFVGEEDEEVAESKVQESQEEKKSREGRSSAADVADAASVAANRDSMSERLLSRVTVQDDDSSSNSDEDEEAPQPRPDPHETEHQESIPMRAIGGHPLSDDPALAATAAVPSLSPPPPPPPPPLPLLFFIHGVGGSAATWSTQLEYFSTRGYEVVAPDLLGHGFSSAPDDPGCYTFAKLFRDLLLAFDHYVRGERVCCVVAHSYGASFGAALARARPAAVTTLVLLASGGPTPLAPPPIVRSVPSAFVSACVKPFLRCGFRRQQRYNASSSSSNGVAGSGGGADDVGAGVRGKALRFQEAFDVPTYVFKHIMAGQSWPEGDANFHRRISAPTLLVYGLKDPFVSLVEMCEMERTLPRAFLELLPLAGHMVMLDQPRELNVMMRRFIEKYNLPDEATTKGGKMR